jgi:uncharacterized protein
MTKTNTDSRIAALLTKLQQPAESSDASFKERLIELMMVGSTFPGFWSAEVVAPQNDTDKEWMVIHRFRSVLELEKWKESEDRLKLLSAPPFSKERPIAIVSDEISTGRQEGEIATAIVTDVTPAAESQYKVWVSKIQAEQAKFPGYQGTYMNPNTGTDGKMRCTTLLRFDSPESLERWINSDIRKQLLEEAKDLISSTKISRVSNSFLGWFPSDPETGNQPPNWKTSMIVLGSLFPIIILQIHFVRPYMTSLNANLGTFICSIMNTAILTWVLMPLMNSLLGWWLFPKEDSPKNTGWLGSSIMIALFAVEIISLWNF